MSNALVSIIIPTYNRVGMLLRCIRSVLNSTYKNLEIIVVDDYSADSTNEEIKRLTKKGTKLVYFRNKKEMLLSYTINKGLKAARGEFILILDDDNVLDPKCISELVSTFNKSDKIGIVGPLALYYSRPDTIMHAGMVRSGFMRRAIYPHMNEVWKGQINEGEEVEEFANAFMFRKELIKIVGGWDLLVPFMGEDGNFEQRVRHAGYKIVINPKAITFHDIEFNEKAYFMRINKMRMFHAMHSKIINEFRYDSTIGKLTFAFSIPAYLAYYVTRIISSDSSEKLEVMSALLNGTISGIIDAIKRREEIMWF